MVWEGGVVVGGSRGGLGGVVWSVAGGRGRGG